MEEPVTEPDAWSLGPIMRALEEPGPTNNGSVAFIPSQTTPCSNRDLAYMSIVITVLPLWAILTTLIVIVLLAFHKNLQVTKVYDNCTKTTAQYVYFIEIRTGETSSNYNRRRTTMTIDMFDDNQTTLARIAVPGHIIFGKRDSPVAPIDDEKYYDLRVTRFWLYRAIKLKKVSTIRLTHTCSEGDAKILVYGVEIRSNEHDRYKLFFPIMSYISAYGSASKPNTGFDLEPTSSISVMGGSQNDSLAICEQLTWIDYIRLLYLLAAFIFFLSINDLIKKSFTNNIQASYKGLVIGLFSFVVTFVIALVLRFVIKQNYALRIGIGFWAIAYHVSTAIILTVSSALWIYTTIYAYKNMCPQLYANWTLSIGVAAAECAGFILITWLIMWFIKLLNPKHTENYLLPDEQLEMASKSRNSYGRYQPGSKQQANWNSQMPYMVPPPTLPPAQVPAQYSNPGLYGQPIIMSPAMMNPMQPVYKTVYQNYELPTQPVPSINPQANYQPAPVRKKVGSAESTGSNYYNQVMKQKGGVKSISQYGELLRKSKAAKKPV